MISVVIPVFNEQDSLTLLHNEIVQMGQTCNLQLEIIFIDDGSSDASWDVIRALAEKNADVHGIRLRRNFGKSAALSAGFAAARGDIIMTLDSDLQDDPAEIPRFVARLNEGLDLVNGWRKTRLDPWHKVWPSRVFNGMVRWLTGIWMHDHNCGMKCYRADVVRQVRLYGERHRFIPVLAAARGFNVGEIAIKHRERQFGRSKYGTRRFIKAFLDLLTVKFLTGFGQRPQHLLGTIGLVSFALGVFALVYLTATWFLGWPHLGPLWICSVAAILLGVQMIATGLVAELVIAKRDVDQPSYSIKETTGPPSMVSPVGVESQGMKVWNES